MDHQLVLFLARMYESRESYCCHFDVSVDNGVGVGGHTLKLCYGQGIVTGELSCTWTGLVSLVVFIVEITSYLLGGFWHSYFPCL